MILHRRTSLGVLIRIILAVGLLPACTTIQTDPPKPTEVFSATATEAIQPVAEISPATPSFTEEPPLRFTFPTPAPLPVSVWRPPLYEVPWALGPYDHFYFTRPIAADEVNWPLADYRYGDFFPGTEIVHTGIDIDATRGTPVLAAGDGKVVWAGYGLYRGGEDPNDPYGLAAVVRHDFGYNGRFLYTVYAHMDRVDVQTDQIVKTGEQLGIVGNTGNTTGPHLHFEVRVESNSFFVTRNPELWLSPPQGWGVLVGRLTQWDGTPIRKLEVFIRSKDSGRTWSVRTYGPSSVNSDDYYQENLVLSDLPSGAYQIYFDYNEESFAYDISIQPGAISFFTFRKSRGFSTKLPDPPKLKNWLDAVASQ